MYFRKFLKITIYLVRFCNLTGLTSDFSSTPVNIFFHIFPPLKWRRYRVKRINTSHKKKISQNSKISLD